MPEEQTTELHLEKAKEVQACVQRTRDEMKDTFVEGVAGANTVKVKMNCCYEMKSIAISDAILEEAVDVGDKIKLQDLIVTAVNDATSQVDTITREAMNSISRALGFSTMG